MINELASHLLPGVPVERVATALGAAAGQELERFPLILVHSRRI